MPPVEPPTPVLGREHPFGDELAVLARDVNAVRVAVGRVDEAVARHVDREMADEVARHRPVRRVAVVRIVDADVLERLAVGAPAALERERVEREHEHAAAEVAVGDVDLVVGFDDADLLDLPDDHRQSQADTSRGTRRAAPPALRRPRDRAAAAAETPRRARGRLARLCGWRAEADGPAVLALGRARDLGDDFAGARIVLAHRVLAEIDEAVAVDVHAVALRRVERADDAARAVEMDHRRRAHAAERERRVELGVQLDVREIVRAVVEPDVLVAVEREPRDAAELPVIRQVLRPRRIEDELGRALRVRAERSGRERRGARRHRPIERSSVIARIAWPS